jgi:hypothetical protein
MAGCIAFDFSWCSDQLLWTVSFGRCSGRGWFRGIVYADDQMYPNTGKHLSHHGFESTVQNGGRQRFIEPDGKLFD